MWSETCSTRIFPLKCNVMCIKYSPYISAVSFMFYLSFKTKHTINAVWSKAMCYHGLCVLTGSSGGHFFNEVLEDLQPPLCSLLQDFSLPRQAVTEPKTHSCLSYWKPSWRDIIFKYVNKKHLTCSHSASQSRALWTLGWLPLWLAPPWAGSPLAPSSAAPPAVSTGTQRNKEF